jgi:hypothetical protein
MSTPGACGQGLADCFHLEAAPAFGVEAPGSLKKSITIQDIFRWRGLYAPAMIRRAGIIVACTA